MNLNQCLYLEHYSRTGGFYQLVWWLTDMSDKTTSRTGGFYQLVWWLTDMFDKPAPTLF